LGLAISKIHYNEESLH